MYKYLFDVLLLVLLDKESEEWGLSDGPSSKKKKKKKILPRQEPQEMQVRSLGGEDPLEEEMAGHSSVLAWRSQGQSMGLHTVRHD